MTLSVDCRSLPLSPPRDCYRHSEAEGLQGTMCFCLLPHQPRASIFNG